MPVVNRGHTYHLLLGDCFWLMAQVQQADRHSSLAYFCSFVLAHGSFDLCQFFRFQWIHRSHSKSVSPLIICFERLLSSETYVGIDVSKDRLDVVALGEKQEKQVDNTFQGIAQLVEWMTELQPE